MVHISRQNNLHFLELLKFSCFNLRIVQFLSQISGHILDSSRKVRVGIREVEFSLYTTIRIVLYAFQVCDNRVPGFLPRS